MELLDINYLVGFLTRLTILAIQVPFKKNLPVRKALPRHYCSSKATNLHKLNV